MTDYRHLDTARRALDYGMGAGIEIVHAAMRTDPVAKAIYGAAVQTIARILEVQAGKAERQADCGGWGHTGCGLCARCLP